MTTIARFAATVVLSAFAQLVGVAAAADGMQQAVVEYQALHHAKAKPMFAALLKDTEQQNLANYYLGRIAIGEGRYTEATEYLEASVGIEPNSADELYWLSVSCYARLARPSEASNMGLFICYLQNLETALSIDPRHLPTLLTLHQFNATGPAAAGASADRAEELLVKIAALSKTDADLARLIVLNSKKETDRAISLAQLIVAAHPNAERALLEAGRTLSNNRRYAEAMTAFDKVTALQVTADNRQYIQAAHVEIGFVAWRTKENFDRGIAALTKSIGERFPVNINTNWAYLRLAQMYKLRGDTAQSKKYWQLLESSPIEKGSLISKEIESVAR